MVALLTFVSLSQDKMLPFSLNLTETEANYLLIQTKGHCCALFVIIQSERTKRRDRYKPAQKNPATPLSSFEYWNFRYYLKSSASSFGWISNIIVREETSGFQLAWCVVWNLCDGDFLWKSARHWSGPFQLSSLRKVLYTQVNIHHKSRQIAQIRYFQLQERQSSDKAQHFR